MRATGNVIGGSVANRNFVFGSQLNDIAVDADANEVSYNVLSKTVGGSVVQIGGNGNTVHDNLITGAVNGDGVEVDGGTANKIQANSIFGNSSLAIDLGATPLGFLVNNVIGGIEWTPTWHSADLTLGLGEVVYDYLAQA